MSIYTEPTEPEFARWESRHAWFESVMLAEYGELETAEDIPPSLNWLMKIPISRRYDFEEAECGMVYVSETGEYGCTIWDVTGEEDEPWAVFVVDDYGARLLIEYSIFEEVSEEARAAILQRAAEELPERAKRGEFTRSGKPLEIPEWLLS